MHQHVDRNVEKDDHRIVRHGTLHLPFLLERVFDGDRFGCFIYCLFFISLPVLHNFDISYMI